MTTPQQTTTGDGTPRRRIKWSYMDHWRSDGPIGPIDQWHSHKTMSSFLKQIKAVGFDAIDEKRLYPVKGHYLKARDLVGNEQVAKIFEGGPLLIARLCPVDYHRYHYPDNGKVLDHFRVTGARLEFFTLAPIDWVTIPTTPRAATMRSRASRFTTSAVVPGTRPRRQRARRRRARRER